MDLSSIRTALATACEGLGLNTYDGIPTSPEFPCVYPSWPTQMYEFSSKGSCNIDIAVTLAVSRADEDSAQAQLNDIVSSGSIIDALFTAPRVEWIDLAFIRIDNFRAEIYSDQQALACDFNLSLRTK